jgi:hypothetical protein
MAKIGDLVPKSGMYTNPGVIVEKNKDGSVKVDTDPMAINRYHRYTNTSGLSEQEKDKFNNILDEIYANDDDVEKINEIQQNIDNLKVDPSNGKIVQYLRNQQAHLIRQSKNLPRSYNMDPTTIRTRSGS